MTTIRRARPDEAAVLSTIAQAAKAHHGHTPEVLAGWRAELTVAPADIAAHPTLVAEIDGEVAAFCMVVGGALEHLWVLPRWMRRGLGRSLLAAAVDLARAAGTAELAIDADPDAETFYLACGARRAGERAAPIPGAPERVRPQLTIAIRS